MITEKIIESEKERIVRPAHYREVDTGNRRQLEIIKPDGQKVIEERPIIERVFQEAIKDKVIVKTTIFAYDDGVDEHHFATEAEAKEFLKSNGIG